MDAVHHATVDEETAMPPALLTFFQRLQAAGVQLPWMTAPN